MPTAREYSIGELASLAGVTPRTIRYYVSIGLLPSPGQQGPRTRYRDAHLARLRLIRTLQREHLPLGEIGARLQGLDDESVEEALALDPSPAEAGSALEYIDQVRARRASPRTELHAFTAAEPGVMPVMAPTPARADSPPEEPVQAQRSQWERVTLSQNVELHIRRPLGRIDQKRVERLIRLGREILEEGDPT